MRAPPVLPARLREGSTVAVLTPSWGGPHEFPGVFDAGLATLRDRFGLVVREDATTRWPTAALAADPAARAAAINRAFADDGVGGIVFSIGGDDAALLLPHLDRRVIAANPKVVMGFSDNSVPLLFCHQLGMVTFNGPSVMAGFAQMSHFPGAEAHLRAVLFEPRERLGLLAPPDWVNEYADWTTGATSEVGERRAHHGWRWLNAPRAVRGPLLGGCVEVLEFLKASPWWPAPEAFDGAVLFLETSEERPSVQQVQRWLFNYGVQGVFDRIVALMVGRARDYTDDEKRELDGAVYDTVVRQFGAEHVVIVTDLDFGHTEPQWVLPLGVDLELDPREGTLTLMGPAVS